MCYHIKCMVCSGDLPQVSVMSAFSVWTWWWTISTFYKLLWSYIHRKLASQCYCKQSIWYIIPLISSSVLRKLKLARCHHWPHLYEFTLPSVCLPCQMRCIRMGACVHKPYMFLNYIIMPGTLFSLDMLTAGLSGHASSNCLICIILLLCAKDVLSLYNH